ncbi:MAG: hypothetical protein AAFX95_28870 [Cyanobacteria bacterium J06639_16]
MSQSDADPVWEPTAPASTPAGFMAPIPIQSDREALPQLSQIAALMLDDPLQVQRLTERVYQLMQDDLRLQRERQGYYGGRH